MATPWSFIDNFTFEDFASDANTFERLMYSIPARRQIEGVMIVPTEAFAHPTASYYTVKIGIIATADLYLDPYDMLGLAPGPQVKSDGSVNQILDLDGWQIRGTADCDGSLDLATAGAFDFFVKLVSIPAGS